MKPVLNLTVSHHVFLTREQRYSLHEGEEFTIIGISLPVWYRNKKTSEPAREVFCNYYLRNPRKEIPIQILDDGYEIYMPMRPAKNNRPKLTDEEWMTLTKHNPAKLAQYYKGRIEEVSSKNLLDFKDGGCGHLNYREHNKVKKNDEFINIMHYVQIEDVEKLNSSLLCGAGSAVSE